MALMPSAFGAVVFGSGIADFVVGFGSDGTGDDLKKAGPAGAAVKFGI